MEKKLLIGLAIVLGLLIVGLTSDIIKTPEPIEPGEEVRGVLINGGHFVLEAAGTRLLEESYTLFYHPVDGYMLLSQGELTAGGETIGLAQQTQYDKAFLPFFYQLGAETSVGKQIISAQMGLEGLHMEVRVGLARQEADVVPSGSLILLDNNVIGHYAMLLMAIQDDALEDEMTVAVPQALLSLPAAVGEPQPVVFVSGDVEHNGTEYEVRLGDLVILLIEYEERLVGLVNRSQGTIGYDIDRFPEGIQIVEDETVDEVVTSERPVTFASGGLMLSGTLRLPDMGEPPYPAVLFIHGSGPVDRDGTAFDPATGAAVMEMDAYRQLSVALAEAGIASLRYDKRGVAESEGDLSAATRADLIGDAVHALAALREQPEIDPAACVLIGHSEGSYLAPAIAAEDGTVAGIVLLAGAARALDGVTRWQVETMLRQAGAPEEQIVAALAQQDEYTEFVKTSTGEWADYTVSEVQEALPWATEEFAEGLLATTLSLSWFREHYNADPAADLRRVTCPVLAVNGSKDSQTPWEEGERIRAILEEAGNTDAMTLVIEDLNHLLRYHPEEPNLIYRHLDEPVDPRLLDAVTSWIGERLVR